MQNTDLREELVDPRVDLDYVGSDEEMEDDVDERDIDQDIVADTDVNEHNDDHDDAVVGSS